MAEKRWRKDTGKHHMVLNGKKIKLVPGDVVKCEKKELGCALDTFTCLDPDPEPEFPGGPEPGVGLVAIHKGSGWYDVRNQVTGKDINDKSLRKDEAEEMALAGVPCFDPPGKEEAKDPFPGIDDVTE